MAQDALSIGGASWDRNGGTWDRLPWKRLVERETTLQAYTDLPCPAAEKRPRALYAYGGQWHTHLKYCSGQCHPAAIRQPMREYRSQPDAGEDLWTSVSLAVNPDTTRRRKSNPDYPRKKKHEAIGAPIVERATAEQRRKARPLLESKHKSAIK